MPDVDSYLYIGGVKLKTIAELGTTHGDVHRIVVESAPTSAAAPPEMEAGMVAATSPAGDVIWVNWTLDEVTGIRAYTDAGTGAALVPNTDFRPIAQIDYEENIRRYVAHTAGAGYAVGDLIEHQYVLDLLSATPLNPIAEQWYNVTQATVITPLMSHLNLFNDATVDVSVGIHRTLTGSQQQVFTANTYRSVSVIVRTAGVGITMPAGTVVYNAGEGFYLGNEDGVIVDAITVAANNGEAVVIGVV